MTFAEVREAVGKIWGTTTTIGLGLGAAALPVLQNVDPQLVTDHPSIRVGIFGVGVGVAVLRVVAPPPPSVPIHLADAVNIDGNAVTIVKDAGVPAHIVDKAPGEKM